MDWKFWKWRGELLLAEAEIEGLQHRLTVLANEKNEATQEVARLRAKEKLNEVRESLTSTSCYSFGPMLDDGVRLQLSEIGRLVQEHGANSEYRYRSLVAKFARLRSDLLPKKKLSEGIDKPPPSEAE